MAVSTRVIKRRIKSVANTRKITKAMELVAASKMRKSVNLTQASRAYSRVLQQMVNHIRQTVPERSHRLLSAPATSSASLVIVAASDRGLCGGFNAQLLKKAIEFLASRDGERIEVVTVGRRAELAVKRAGYPIVASFEAISNAPSFERSAPVGEFAFQAFIQQRVDRVFMVYTDFKSALAQIPTAMQLLPIIPEADLKEDTELKEEDGAAQPVPIDAPDILFEPSPQEVLVSILPRLLETQVYQSLLESSASEHSSRMMAMRSATDNATDMLQDLTFTFNQARQASITREISEISAGKAAIE